jgi:hypothetical protein
MNQETLDNVQAFSDTVAKFGVSLDDVGVVLSENGDTFREFAKWWITATDSGRDRAAAQRELDALK